MDSQSDDRKVPVEVTVYQWVQRAHTVTVLAGPDDDIEDLALQALPDEPEDEFCTDSKVPEFDYKDPFTGELHEGGNVYEITEDDGEAD